ncbi:MAG: anthranilate synthase component I family protein [Planctomycetales bacterium]
MPVVVELENCPDPWQAMRHLADWADPVLLESNLRRAHVGRYSFLTADPYRRIDLPRVEYGTDPLAEVRRILQVSPQPTVAGLPPFQGGAVGLLSYECAGAWERLPRSGRDEFQFPDLAIGFYDWVLAWDHEQGRAWIIAHDVPGKEGHSRLNAGERVRQVRARLQEEPVEAGVIGRKPGEEISAERISPQFPVPNHPEISSNFERSAYLRAVERVLEYLRAGDIFQVNLAQRLLARQSCSAGELYARLRRKNPAPFSALVVTADWALISASPERFLAVKEGEVETRPIKGTRRRQAYPAADLFTRDELRESSKDLAENTMIVDLLRNDLSKVCQPGSMKIPQLCQVEMYETVQHLVSEVRGFACRRMRCVGSGCRRVFPRIDHGAPACDGDHLRI